MDLIITALLLSVSILLLLSGVTKLISYKATIEYIESIEWIPSILKKTFGYTSPIIEIIFAVGLVVWGNSFIVNILATLMIMVFLTINIRAVLTNEVKDCHCFGNFIKTQTGFGGVIQSCLMLIPILLNLLTLVHPINTLHKLDNNLLFILIISVCFIVYTFIMVRSIYETFNEAHV